MEPVSQHLVVFLALLGLPDFGLHLNFQGAYLVLLDFYLLSVLFRGLPLLLEV